MATHCKKMLIPVRAMSLGNLDCRQEQGQLSSKDVSIAISSTAGHASIAYTREAKIAQK